MEEVEVVHFHEMEIDDRIQKAIAKLGWREPTLIQEKAIPLLLEGKDVLVRARTGSGKTGAFAIPLIQKILQLKMVSTEQVTRGLVLAPSKELCQQLLRNFNELTLKCSREVVCVDVSRSNDVKNQRPILRENPDIVIGTPSRAMAHIQAGNLSLKDLEMIIIDEADLVFTFGFDEPLNQLIKHLPKVYQAILASATLTDEVLQLKKLVLRSPVILKLQEPDIAPLSQLTHFHIQAQEEEKAVILYALLKLNLVRGKTIIFVNNTDRCYKLKLYLEQFALPSCVLNSELPATIRCHAVSQFNQGIYDVIIASDEALLEKPQHAPSAPSSSKRQKDQESGVARGIDFQFVSNVINFDFPKTVNSYIHRAGRTARGNNEGTALSFVSVAEQPLLDAVEDHLKTSFDDENETFVKAYEFKVEEVEGFRYRARDAWKAVTKIAIREARLKEIKNDLLNCNKLKAHFEENPRDLVSLRHDKALHTVKLQPHLANVPDYIIPESLKKIGAVVQRRKRRGGKPKKSQARARYEARQSDPLMSLKFNGFKKKK